MVQGVGEAAAVGKGVETERGAATVRAGRRQSD